MDVSIYRKPTHTDRYLHFESHHPTHVKRGVVRCLHDRAREIISTQDNLQKEVDHLARVVKQNGYPANFIRDASTPPMQETADTSGRDEEQEREKEPLVVIPYVAGMSEDIRRVCRKFNIRVVFKSGRTLRSMLTKVKDTLPLGKQSNVVSYPLQLRPGLHRGDQTETGDKAEGTLGCLREGDDGEVSCSGTCVGESPSDLPQYWTVAEERNCC